MENDQSTSPELKPKPKPNSTQGPQPRPPLTSLSSELDSGRLELKRWSRVRTMWPRMQRLVSPALGQFWVIGGNPGNYKTQTMWNLALDVASCQQRVLFVSLEIEPWSMSLKAVSRFARIPLDRLKEAGANPDAMTSAECETAAKAEDRIRELDLLMRMHGARNGRSTIEVLASACRNRFAAIFVDHLGMMARQANSELDEIPKAVEAFRALAHGELVAGYSPLVCLASPLKRVEDASDDRLPQMSDLRGSQRIESDADVVMILQKRPAKEDSGAPDIVDGFVVKNRDGIAPVVLIFDADGSTCTVRERRPEIEEPPPEDWRDGR
jgi:replicative DNA helicase